jgi:hypothetical protein
MVLMTTPASRAVMYGDLRVQFGEGDKTESLVMIMSMRNKGYK